MSIFFVLFFLFVSSAKGDGCGSEVKLCLGGTPPHEPQLIQGPPGKRGPHGKKGESGEKGEKGDIYMSAPELQEVKDELEKYREENSNLKVSLEKLTQKYINLSEKFNLFQNLTNETIEKVNNFRFLQFPKTCSEIYRNDLTMISGSYTIFPENNQPVKVYCEVTNQAARTVMKHDSQSEISVNGYEEPYSYGRVVTYENSMDQIEAVIKLSKECRQYIKYRCKGSVLFNGDSTDHASWTSRDGIRRSYWGGSIRDGYCACGEKGTCVSNRHNAKCNCDGNDGSITTSDEGYLTQTDLLPVIKINFGDTGGSGEQGWHTLGPLECV